MSHVHNWFLSSLGPELALLSPQLSASHFPAGAVVWEPDDEIRQIYFPTTAVLSLVTVLPDGRSLECCTMGNETAFGLMAAHAANRSFTRLVVQLGGWGYQVSVKAMQDACAGNAAISALVTQHVHAAWAYTARSAACHVRHSLEARLCRWLLTCADYVEADQFSLTKEYAAAMLGVQRVSVTNIANALGDRGLLRMRRGEVTILDRQGLRAASCGCHGLIRARIDEALAPPGLGRAYSLPE